MDTLSNDAPSSSTEDSLEPGPPSPGVGTSAAAPRRFGVVRAWSFGALGVAAFWLASDLWDVGPALKEQGALGMATSVALLVLIACAAGGLLGLGLMPLAVLANYAQGAGGGRRSLAALIPAVALTPALVPVASQLTSGSWIGAQPWAPALRLGLVVGGFFALWFGTRVVLSSVRRTRGAGVVPWAAAAVAGVCLVVDRRVLLNYDPFHLLVLGALAVSAWVFGVLSSRGGFAWQRWALLPLASSIIIPTLVYAGKVPGDDPARRDLLLNRATATQRVLLPFARAAGGGQFEADSDFLAAVGKAQRVPTEVADARVPARRDLNVVMVTIDTLRADRCGYDGYTKHPTTPNLDALAKESVIFSAAWTQHPSSQLAMASMFKGLFPLGTDVARSPKGPFKDVTLAQRLRAEGRKTVAVTAFSRDLMGRLFSYLRDGFDRYVHSQGVAPFVAGTVADRTLRELGGLPEDAPWFLWVHFFDPHDPYTPPSQYSSFGGAASDRYDGEIAYTDRELGRILDELRSRPDWDRTVVIANADHGEEFSEHGGSFHHSSLYEEQVRVPLLIRIPGVEPRVVEEPVGLVDLPETLFDLLGLPSNDRRHGRSLLPAALGGASETPFAFAQFRAPERRISRLDAFRAGKWKLIRNLTTGTWHLYDLDADPGERNDVAAREPEVLQSMRARLMTCTQLAGEDGTRPRKLEELGPEELRDHLRKMKPDQRRRSLRGLANRGQFEATLPLLTELIGRKDISAGDAILGASQLGVWRYEPAIPKLLGLLAGDRRELRKDAAFALCHFEDAGVRARLRELWPAALPGERPFLAMVRGAHGDRAVALELAAIVKNLVGDQLTLGAAVGARVGPRNLERTLAGLIRDEGYAPWWIELVALRCGARMESMAVLMAAYERINDKPTGFVMARQYLDAVEHLDPDVIAPLLRRLLAHRDRAIGDRVAALLERIGKARWIELFRDANGRIGSPWGGGRERAQILKGVFEGLLNEGIIDWGLARDLVREAIKHGRLREVGPWLHQIASARAAAPEAVRGLIRQIGWVARQLGQPSVVSLQRIAGTDQMPTDGRPWTAVVRVAVDDGGGALLGGNLGPISRLEVSFRHLASGRRASGPHVYLPFPGLLGGEEAMLVVRANVPDLPAGPVEAEIRCTGIGVKGDPLRLSLIMGKR